MSMNFKKFFDLTKLLCKLCDPNYISIRDIQNKIDSYSYYGILDNFKIWKDLGYVEDKTEEKRKNFKKVGFRLNKKGTELIYNMAINFLKALMKRIKVMPESTQNKWRLQLKRILGF